MSVATRLELYLTTRCLSSSVFLIGSYHDLPFVGFRKLE